MCVAYKSALSIRLSVCLSDSTNFLSLRLRVGFDRGGLYDNGHSHSFQKVRILSS